MADLLGDYIAGSPELLAHYGGPPGSVLTHPIAPRAWDGALAEEMATYQAHLGAPKQVDSDRGVFITGQQPGIFAGPLYTIYKAITTLKLASWASAESPDSLSPIYWVGGDDHDFDEISHVHLLSKHHTAVPLRLPAEEGQPPVSIFRLPAQEALHDLIDQAAAEAPGSEFREGIQTFLHDSLSVSANLSEWHARLMARLFRDTPLLIFTPELAAARRAAIPVFEREIKNPGASTVHLNAGGDRLAQAGYGAQVVKDEASTNFFVEHRNMRCRVHYLDGGFVLPDTGERFDTDAMLDWLHREPECFTANVALRCIVQQHLFPVRAYVAGPGELAYWGQLKEVFAHFDTPMPIVYPRIRGVLTSIKTNKLLKKLGMTLAELSDPVVELEDRALRNGSQNPSQVIFHEKQAALKGILQELQQEYGSLGRGAVDLATQFGGQVEHALERFERGLLRLDEARVDTVRKQLERLTTEVAPERKPQERYYTLFSWLFQHGWGLIPRLTSALDHREHGVQEVEL